LCSDRVGAGLEPACIKSCPTGCLHFGSKEDMKFEAMKRIDQLHANGHANAGIYNPGDPDQKASSPGSIGGTHVIYVLGDARDPEKYGGLPASPSVPLFVKLWKGPLKWIGGLGMIAGLAALFGHYVRYGPKPLHDEGDEGRRAQ
ncbi:MAG TPA: formate dehydrogenase N subunit beta transmembrane domain-containing protein, partial [Candidatus Angelobacter sp.]|nr:formate dehydrogenase N subunit beta transmembrane domain-containing protein [Candidatus Angelobacter sp.]